jgi:hypothetical protein
MTAIFRAPKSVSRATRKDWQAASPKGLLFLCVCLAMGAPGCGHSKSKAPAQTAAAEAEQKAEEPAEKPPEKAPEKIAKKPVEAKPAAPVARRPQDLTKWQLADLKSGLSAHDLRFAAAVLFFSLQNRNGKTEAQELKGLLESAAGMPDDTSISLPLSPAPVAAAVTAAKPVVPGAAAAPAQAPATPTLRQGSRSPGKFGGGLKGSQ